jgi:hypothetical protein
MVVLRLAEVNPKAPSGRPRFAMKEARDKVRQYINEHLSEFLDANGGQPRQTSDDA